MTEDRDLLPWILGALSMAAIAMAVAIGVSGKAAPTHADSPNSAVAPTLATAELNPPVTNGIARAAAPSSIAPPPAFAASDRAGDQIWECTVDGVKTFSNKRCGSAAVLRDVGPINVMDASPASNVHWYGPDTNDAPDDYYPAPQPVDNAYPVVVGVPYLERRRPERPHQPAHSAAAHGGAIGAR